MRGLLLVENLGTWRDLPDMAGWLTVHIPGWDTRSTEHLLKAFDAHAIVHFGDLDPNGVRIAQSLRAKCPQLQWFVPDFWRDYIATHARPLGWPRTLNLAATPPLVQELAAAGQWLEQECLALDERTLQALRASADTPSHSE